MTDSAYIRSKCSTYQQLDSATEIYLLSKQTIGQLELFRHLVPSPNHHKIHSTMSTTLQTTSTSYIDAPNGVRFGFRRLGSPSPINVPLVLHIHFRANMDLWDPLFIKSLAAHREVIIFDNAGVGRSSGTVPDTFQGWADNVIALVRALGIQKFDLLGFSMGGIAVQYVALTVPDMVRKLIVAGSRPAAPIVHRAVKEGGGEFELVQPPAEPIVKLRTSVGLEEGKESIYFSFFPHTTEGREDFEKYWSRIQERKVEDEPLILDLLDKDVGAMNQIRATILDQKQAGDKDFLKQYTGSNELTMPVFVANGDNDLLIPTSRSWELFSKVEEAHLRIYPKAGHGFIWQCAESFADDVNKFLDSGAASDVQAKL